MVSTDPAVAILPIDLGTAAAFDQNVFPHAYYEGGDNLSKGTLLIRATLEEMEEIHRLGIDLNENQDFIFNTRLKLEALKDKKAKLEDNRKTFNPIKALLNYKAAWSFHARSRDLYLQTKRTSERIQREERPMRVVPSTQMRAINDPVSPDAVIVGVAVDLPDGLNEHAQQTIDYVKATITAAGCPFQDDTLVSQLRDGEEDGSNLITTDGIQIGEQAITLPDTASFVSQDVYGSGVDEGNQTSVAFSDIQLSRPTSPPTVIQYIIRDSIVTTNSSLNSVTVNRGSRNSGASVTQALAP